MHQFFEASLIGPLRSGLGLVEALGGDGIRGISGQFVCKCDRERTLCQTFQIFQNILEISPPIFSARTQCQATEGKVLSVNL